MHIFEFTRPADSAAAINAAAQSETAQQGADVRFLAGGTTLIDLMKLNVETPTRVLDINRLPLDKIEDTSDGGLKIGATVRNSDLANEARGAARLFRALPGDSFRRVGADPQHGYNRREPGAENALRLFPRHGYALQ